MTYEGGVVHGPAWPRSSAGELRRVLFLDRDGIDNANHGYVHTPEATDWIPGIFDLCAAAVAAGYGLVVVTNQAGIARGYYDRAEFETYTRWMHCQFQAHGLALLATYYCPHHPEAGIGDARRDCTCRKPRPGMLVRAAEDLGIDLAASVLVGDAATHVAAAEAAGLRMALMVEPEGAGGPGLLRLGRLFDERSKQHGKEAGE